MQNVMCFYIAVLCVIMLSVIMLSVIMLSVVMLSVVAPYLQARMDPHTRLHSEGRLLALAANRVEVYDSAKHTSLLQHGNEYGRKNVFQMQPPG